MISVIVCTYNQEKTIGRTLDHILQQQCHMPLEIVIGEDCSTDGTLQVCQDYAKRYPDIIRLFANNPNKGLLDNYYDCIFAARGEYIADCAGDDYWCDPLKLEKEVTILEQNPDVGIVHTEWQFRNSVTGNTYPPVQPIYTDRFIDGNLLLENILTQRQRPVIHLCTALYRTSWIRKAHDEHRHFFRNKTYRCEDVQLCFFLARMGRVAYLPDVTLSYSRGGETVSWTIDEEKQARFIISTAQLTYDLAHEFSLLTPKVKQLLQWRIYEILMHAMRAHSKALRQKAITYQHKWQLSMDRRIFIVRLATSTEITWQLTLLLRKIFVKLKKL